MRAWCLARHIPITGRDLLVIVGLTALGFLLGALTYRHPTS